MLMPSNYVPTPDLLADRNVLISGAGDGIGKALAMACARAGASTLLLGRTTSKLEDGSAQQISDKQPLCPPAINVSPT